MERYMVCLVGWRYVTRFGWLEIERVHGVDSGRKESYILLNIGEG